MNRGAYSRDRSDEGRSWRRGVPRLDEVEASAAREFSQGAALPLRQRSLVDGGGIVLNDD